LSVQVNTVNVCQWSSPFVNDRQSVSCGQW